MSGASLFLFNKGLGKNSPFGHCHLPHSRFSLILKNKNAWGLFLLEADCMKISVAWLFDHLGADWHAYDMRDLMARLSATTAEIDGAEPVSWAWNQFFIAEVIARNEHEVQIKIAERKKQFKLPARLDAALNAFFLVVMTENTVRWATLADLSAGRDGLVPALLISPTQLEGAWRDGLEQDDWIIEIDNKSLTNRPDLWGHRGFAREVAALVGLKLLPEEQICVQKPIRHYEKKAPYIDLSPDSACSRFAGIKVTKVTCEPSRLFYAHRLARVDAKAMNTLVDFTNYVMLDIGHPMHVFDADKVEGSLVVRQARNGEKLALLDGDTVELSSADCVVADERKPLSVAGVMGGSQSAFQQDTKAIILEAALFDAAAIRRTAARLKKRTESSARFEKSLDPNQNTVALSRYLWLLEASGVSCTVDEAICSVGPLSVEHEILLPHRLLVERLGATITESQVCSILSKLDFGVQVIESGQGLSYSVTVPTFRGTKDIRIPEDIIEEVARFFGYDAIPLVMPVRVMRPYDMSVVHRKRLVKQLCATALSMREVQTYPLFDERWLKQLNYQPVGAPALLNPVSEHWGKMVTSLIPGILQAIATNAVSEKRLRFFELNRVWSMPTESEIKEQQVCSGIFYERAGISFYEAKALLEKLFIALGHLVEWRKPIDGAPFWAEQYRVAELWIGKERLGYAGMVAQHLLTVAAEGEAFAFEFDLGMVLSIFEQKEFVIPGRYQAVSLDISMFCHRRIAVSELEEAIALSDSRIKDVFLLDVFEKDEWPDRRSVALRYVVQDDTKTLSKEEIDEVQNAVYAAVKPMGVEIR
ncbi:TPA: hypothetical protein DEG75_01750 [Candidatus Dependentiae bacterium]|nr:hypothetical protein [Candidatus Dependentiae bacterium]